MGSGGPEWPGSDVAGASGHPHINPTYGLDGGCQPVWTFGTVMGSPLVVVFHSDTDGAARPGVWGGHGDGPVVDALTNMVCHPFHLSILYGNEPIQ